MFQLSNMELYMMKQLYYLGVISLSWYWYELIAVKVWQTYCEKQPLKFLDRELLPHLVYVTKKLAKFVGEPAIVNIGVYI